MNNQTLINTTLSLCDRTNAMASDLIELCVNTPMEIPNYEEVKNSDMELYTRYADVIAFNNDVSIAILKITKCLITLKDSVGKIAKDKSIPVKLAKEYIDKLNRELLPISEKLKALKEFKISLESHIKFYQNASFLLTNINTKMF